MKFVDDDFWHIFLEYKKYDESQISSDWRKAIRAQVKPETNKTPAYQRFEEYWAQIVNLKREILCKIKHKSLAQFMD